MTKKEWKTIHRQVRIVRREIDKAFGDFIVFGSGACEISPTIPDLIRHVPIDEILL